MMKPNSLWALAALLMAAITVLHIVAGGAQYVPPLLAQNSLDASQTGIYYYVWHMASLSMAATALMFAGAARWPTWKGPAMLMSYLVLAFAGLNLWTGLRFDQFPWAHPQWLLFAIAGGVALLAGMRQVTSSSHG